MPGEIEKEYAGVLEDELVKLGISAKHQQVEGEIAFSRGTLNLVSTVAYPMGRAGSDLGRTLMPQ